jgi:hypothetical protein
MLYPKLEVGELLVWHTLLEWLKDRWLNNYGKPGGRRRADRPRLRWLDDVEEDWRTMGIKRWRLIAKDRTEWVGIVREARAVKSEREREKIIEQVSNFNYLGKLISNELRDINAKL